jgi:putative Mg2+ transporter-C (MgtC) family protein
MIEGAVTHISETDIVLRIILATVLSSIVGIEREFHHKPAGLRTNVMVGLGSCLFTLVSIRATDIFPNLATIDPTRIAAQIVTGIGFLGAGTILFEKDRSSVIGLTTAATLWVVAAVGTAIGMGLYVEAIVGTLMVFFTFLVLSKVVNEVRKRASDHVEHDDTAMEANK